MPKKPSPSVRILPMSRKLPQFVEWDEHAIQDAFFLTKLPAGNGRFHYTTTALQSAPGTIVLFQYAGFVVALAELLETVRFDRPIANGEFPLRGFYQFDPLSIRTFTPVGVAHLQKFWPRLPGLGQVKHKLDPAAYKKFVKSLRKVRKPKSAS